MNRPMLWSAARSEFPTLATVMLLRQLATAASSFLRRAGNDGGVLAALRAEIAHELSSSSSSSSSSPPSFQSKDGEPGFDTVLDSPRGQEVLLRRCYASEEVLVSALLAPLRFHGAEPLPRDALMKVFVSKPGVESVVQFDCRLSADEDNGRHCCGDSYDITAVRYHSFPGDAGEERYEGPKFRDFKGLERELKAYLVARGINSILARSLRHHLIEKERVQYVNWLKTLEEMFSKDY